MRVLFTPHWATQHLYPMVPLAWACRAAGHDVRIAGVPALADAMTATGLPVTVVGRDLPADLASDRPAPTGWPPDSSPLDSGTPFPPDWPLQPHRLDERQRAIIARLGLDAAAAAEYLLDGLLAVAEDWRPQLIVHNATNFAGAVAATALGVPNVRFVAGPGQRPMERRLGDGRPLPEYVALFDRIALEPRVAPSMTIDPSPPSLRLPVADPYLETRCLPYHGPGCVPSWLDEPAGRPRVCVAWRLGRPYQTDVGGQPVPDPFRLVLDALAALDVEILVVGTQDRPEPLGPLPAGARAATAVPLSLALPHCTAIVHQAEDCTALTAAALGVPQLTITSGPSAVVTGGRLANVGVGIHLRYQELLAEQGAGGAVRAAAEKLLTDQTFQDAAGLLRDEIERQPVPASLTGTLELLAKEAR